MSTPRIITSDAETCRQNNWQVGDKLIGTEYHGLTQTTSVILITAIGERHILAREVERNWDAITRGEGHWCLSHRDWKKVE